MSRHQAKVFDVGKFPGDNAQVWRDGAQQAGTGPPFRVDDGNWLIEPGDAPDRRPSAYDSLVWRETQALLVAEIGKLPENEAIVVRQHYDHGLSFASVARLMNLSGGRVSQLHRAALERLRKRLRTKGE